MTRTKIGIVNITGYIGIELARILMCHPEVKITSVTGRSSVGQKVAEVFPHLYNLDLTIGDELDDVDIAFSALPHKVSAETVLGLLNRGINVIDASADFRLKDPTLYPVWYQFDHPAPKLLAEAVYGLPELHRDEIPAARLIANPGCYPTSAILALGPAIKEGILEGHLVIDSKSGVSGAGRSPTLTTHFSEVNESISAYALSGHRHLPEIIQELQIKADNNPQSLTFIPHLIPMTRGMLSSCYGRLKQGILPLNKIGIEELLA
ncbi:N-acetyl-gamma-glutamyl-phosphate reductase, partial [Chloroflexota bacterium]